MTMYLDYNVGIYITIMLPYSDYYTMLMLSVYMHEYSTLRIYVAIVFPYLVGRGVKPKHF